MTDSAEESSDPQGEAGGSTDKPDLGDVTTADDEIFYSIGEVEWEAYNGNTAATNSTYNAVVNGRLQEGFWYWGTDGTVYPNEEFGTYEQTSEDPLTVEYTISDEAVWEDGTPDHLQRLPARRGRRPTPSPFSATRRSFDPVSDTFGVYVPDGLDTEPDSKTFTVVYPEPYPDWELVGRAPLPAHVVAEQAGLEPTELAQAILDGDAEAIAPGGRVLEHRLDLRRQAAAGPGPGPLQRPVLAQRRDLEQPRVPHAGAERELLRPCRRPPRVSPSASRLPRRTSRPWRTVTSTSSSRRPPSTPSRRSRRSARTSPCCAVTP